MASRTGDLDSLDRIAHALLAPFDRVRRELLRALGGSLAPFVREPTRRVAWLGSVGLVLVGLVATRMPVLLLLFGPLLLGVPHLLADLRYLVIRPRLHRRIPFVFFALVPSALAFFYPVLEVVGVCLVGAALATRGSVARRVGLSAIGVVVLAVARAVDRRGEIVFAHLHNAIAFAWCLAGFARTRGGRRDIVIPTSVAAALALAIATGLLESRGADTSIFEGAGLSLGGLVSSLSPTTDPTLALRFVALFAFGQAAHYAVWLRFVPDLARERKAPRSFRASFDALRCEMGGPFLVVASLLALLFPTLALVDAAFARDAYLRLALFHGPLEMAIAGVFFVEGDSDASWAR